MISGKVNDIEQDKFIQVGEEKIEFTKKIQEYIRLHGKLEIHQLKKLE